MHVSYIHVHVQDGILSLCIPGMLAKKDIPVCGGPNQCSGEGLVGYTAALLVSMVALVVLYSVA